MFNPSQQDVRRFFCETFRKVNAGLPMTPLETIAGDWLREHPEYRDVLSSQEQALVQEFPAGSDGGNPFLHLSMHLSIAEQISIDQPPGIRAAAHALAQRRQSLHDAHHEIMECLGEMLWTSQRNNTPPDAAAYVEAVRCLL